MDEHPSPHPGTFHEPALRSMRKALDILFPPQCLKCGAIIESSGTLCGKCWLGFEFITDPQCAACGIPFEFGLGPDALCGACTRRHPDYDRARSSLVYNGDSRELILAFKHADQLNMAPAFANWMTRAGARLLEDTELILPVPLHWTRLFTRRFNQSALLAQAIGKSAERPVAVGALVRCKRTPSQGRLNRRQRRENLRGAFRVRAHPDEIRGRNVLLVDDVLTTGATVSSAARALRKAGAARVDVLTLARVVAPQEH